MRNKGFTLIELIVVIAIIAILSAIILFSITQYISKGKDSNIAGNLAVLIPAGEVYYNVGNTYNGFCQNDVVTNAISQMPVNSAGSCYNASLTSVGNPAGVCCFVGSDGNSWAACAREFANNSYAFCVDSRGVKKDIEISACNSDIVKCP